MSRSVVKRGVPRCPVCRFAWRWCLCPALRTTVSPLRIDVLAHRHEVWRPTSTGHLIRRVLPAARLHVFQPGAPLPSEDVADPAREFWILHPNGEPMPSGADAASVQVMLLDGNWRESGKMRLAVESWGRLIQVQGTGPSRYWLRDQSLPDRYSTVEALLFLLDALGREEEASVLREQTELMVYAGLLSRGAKGAASRFLASSPCAARLEALVGLLGASPVEPGEGDGPVDEPGPETVNEPRVDGAVRGTMNEAD